MNTIVHSYEFEDDIVYETEVYTCACCGKIILDGSYHYEFCSEMCAREFEELGVLVAICG